MTDSSVATPDPSAEQASPGKISWRLVVSTTLVLVTLAFAADAASAVMSLESHLRAVADHLAAVETRLGEGDLQAARSEADRARRESSLAADAVDRPSLALASSLPGLDRETDAVEAAVRAADLSADAAASIVESAVGLDIDEEGVPRSLYVEGQVQLDLISQAREQVNEAELSLVSAVVALEEADPRLGQLEAPIAQARERASEALNRVTRGRRLLDLLSGLLGGNGKRTYMLALQAPGEARATGGLVGLVGVLSAEDGRLALEDLSSGGEVFKPQLKGIAAPSWFETSYEPQKALTQWQQANVSPNYPVVSDVLLEMYKQSTGTQLDGVIAMDPLALAEMMKGMGPIETANPPTTVDATNVTEVLLRNSYVEFELETDQDKFLKQVVDGFWNQISEGDLDLRLFAEGLTNALRAQHVKLFSTDKGDQRLLDELDLDGNYDTLGPFAQMAFNINYAVNKIDYFLQRDVTTEIDLQADGTAAVITTMRLHNQAPPGPPSILLGESELGPGVNRTMVNLLMPPGSQVTSFTVGRQQRGPFLYTDENSPVAWDVISLGPGARQTVSGTYLIPGAIQILGERTVFDFVLFPQPTVNPDRYSLRINPPPDVEVVDTPGMTEDGVLEMSGTLEEPVVVRMQMEPE